MHQSSSSNLQTTMHSFVLSMGRVSQKRTRAIKATATIVSLVASSASTTTSAMTPRSNNKRQKRAPEEQGPTPISPDSGAALRTESFSPLWSGTLPNFPLHIEPHTLILGTHPSIKSLEQQRYYGHPINAFWWIAGDCLGFRRQDVISPATGKAYAFSSLIRYDNIIPYEEQVETLVSKGFAMWDVVKSCQRKGSLDQDIKDEIPNDIRGFCQEHPTIERIVLANGGTGSSLFVKHWKEWFDDPDYWFVPLEGHDASEKAFRYAKKKHAAKKNNSTSSRRIELISAISVSPAAAKYTYEQKRGFWEKHVYQPGLMARAKLAVE